MIISYITNYKNLFSVPLSQFWFSFMCIMVSISLEMETNHNYSDQSHMLFIILEFGFPEK